MRATICHVIWAVSAAHGAPARHRETLQQDAEGSGARQWATLQLDAERAGRCCICPKYDYTTTDDCHNHAEGIQRACAMRPEFTCRAEKEGWTTSCETTCKHNMP